MQQPARQARNPQYRTGEGRAATTAPQPTVPNPEYRTEEMRNAEMPAFAALVADVEPTENPRLAVYENKLRAGPQEALAMLKPKVALSQGARGASLLIMVAAAIL